MFDHTLSQKADITPLKKFAEATRLAASDQASFAAGVIGKGATFQGEFGPRKIVYADYVASGRAHEMVEDFVRDSVLPFYANTHTDASYCGATTTHMREEARAVILDHCNANPSEHAVIYSGAGATAALNKMVHLFGVRKALETGREVHVLIGPYEHHSNILPWRESGATVVQIDENLTGGPDIGHIQSVLQGIPNNALIIGSFSAASNVTGIETDVAKVSRVIKSAGGLSVWDFAGGGPYLQIDMHPEDVSLDAIVFSPHKFIGGPGASGVLLIRRDAVVNDLPERPGGGTVAFVNDRVHDYLSCLEEREEGGTPNIVGDIRAALAIILKDALGQNYITERNQWLTDRALSVWGGHPAINLLGGSRNDRLPIFSFIVDAGSDEVFDFHLYTRALSDIYGIQARGGCACAGPYVHELLRISPELSAELRGQILHGDETHKPGFVRMNFSVLMDDQEVDYILLSVVELAGKYSELAEMYAQSRK